MKKVFAFFLWISVLYSCKDDLPILQTDYEMTFSVSNNDVYSVSNNSVNRLGDERLENIQDNSILGEALGDSLTTFNLIPFGHLFFEENNRGYMVLHQSKEELDISYTWLLDVVKVEIGGASRKINFRLEDGGAKINSCEYIVLKINDDFADLVVLSLFDCNGMTKDEAAEYYMNNGALQDTFSIVRLDQRTRD